MSNKLRSFKFIGMGICLVNCTKEEAQIKAKQYGCVTIREVFADVPKIYENVVVSDKLFSAFVKN